MPSDASSAPTPKPTTDVPLIDSPTMPGHIAILGAGSWGLALARLLAREGRQVIVWGRNAQKIDRLAGTYQQEIPFPLTLPKTCRFTTQLPDAVRGAALILLVVTTAGTASILQQLQTLAEQELFPDTAPRPILVNGSKGITYPDLKTVSTLVADTLPGWDFAVLSGPNLAPEVVRDLPTASVVASTSLAVAEQVQRWLATEHFRIYTNDDVIGVELAGALKNIFAIVSGYMDARQFGDNAKATLLTRGLAEMTRFCCALGGQVNTLYGMSGLGDLLATCNSPLSRNYQVGYRLAQGEPIEAIVRSLQAVAEGVQTTLAVSKLADSLGIDMPVVQQVKAAVTEGISEAAMIHTLMSRKLRSECTG